MKPLTATQAWLAMATALIAPCLISINGCTPVGELAEVNAYVNKSIVYRPDPVDTWQFASETLALGTGDCEDYAILKADLLKTDALLHIVKTKSGTWHAILESNGYFLDNRFNTLLTASQKVSIYGPTYASAPVSTWLHTRRRP